MLGQYLVIFKNQKIKKKAFFLFYPKWNIRF